MISHNNATHKYAAYSHANMTVSNIEKVIMLYDGILKFIKQAKLAIENKNIQERYNNIEKAIKIVNGLQANLDYKNGGEVAAILDDYYFAIYMKLSSIHSTNSTQTCDDLIEEIKGMKKSWVEVNQKTIKDRL